MRSYKYNCQNLLIITLIIFTETMHLTVQRSIIVSFEVNQFHFPSVEYLQNFLQMVKQQFFSFKFQLIVCNEFDLPGNVHFVV